MSEKEYAIIVAGGIGSRMKSPVPKQFIPVNGLPVLMHTISIFHEYSESIELIVVIPATLIDDWQALCEKYKFTVSHTITAGGETRFQSVRKGLQKIGDKGIAAVHDGVRPLVNKEIIAASFQIAAVHGSAIAAVRLMESIRVTDKDGTKMVNRSNYRIIQTPQTFKIPLLKEAYLQAEQSGFTDDASVVEKAGYKISLFEGSYRNIKITTPDDLLVAAALLKKQNPVK